MQKLTLGELIAKLEKFSPGRPVRAYYDGNPDAVSLGEIGSYRGYYEDLAFEPTILALEPKSVGDVLTMARSAMGRDFEGYKGGDYPASEHTALWLSNYGHCSHQGIVGLEERDGAVWVKTYEELF